MYVDIFMYLLHPSLFESKSSSKQMNIDCVIKSPRLARAFTLPYFTFREVNFACVNNNK